jgi:hypothetical protein
MIRIEEKSHTDVSLDGLHSWNLDRVMGARRFTGAH